MRNTKNISIFIVIVVSFFTASCGNKVDVSGSVSDADKVVSDANKLAIGFSAPDSAGSVTGNLTLPVKGANGSSITWVSGDPSVIARNGVVTRPPNGTASATVYLTATITNGSEAITRSFMVTVLETPPTNTQAVLEDSLTLSPLFTGTDNVSNVTGNLTLPTTGPSGTTISWVSDTIGVVANDGTVTPPPYSGGDVVVNLTATITKGGQTQVIVCSVVVKAGPPPSGSLDLSYARKNLITDQAAAGGVNLNDYGFRTTIQPDGKILITGTSVNGAANEDMVIWRYNSNGTLDTTFNGKGLVTHNSAAGGNLHDRGYDIAVQNDGKIVVTGYSINAAGNVDMALWRYNPDGTLDTTFNGTGFVTHNSAAGGNSSDYGTAIILKNDGKIIIAGGSINAGANYDLALWCYNPDGTLDTTFNNTGIVIHNSAAGGNSADTAMSMTALPDGKMLVSGYSVNPAANWDMAIWRFNPDGTLDTTFNTTGYLTQNGAAWGNGSDFGHSIKVQQDGKIVLAGASVNPAGNEDMVLWRFNPDGTPDTTFGGIGYVVHHSAAGGNSNDRSIRMQIQPDGKYVLTGYSFNAAGNEDGVIWRFNPNGSLDTTFNGVGYVVQHGIAGGNGSDIRNDIAVQVDGTIITIGYSANAAGNFDMFLQAHSSDGSVARVFAGGSVAHNLGWLEAVNCSAIQSDGKIVLTGYANINGGTYKLVWRYNADGTLDTTFNGSGYIYTGIAGEVGNSVAIQSDGKILVAGTAGVNEWMVIWRYNTNGTLDTTFGTIGTGWVMENLKAGFNDMLYSVAIQDDGKIVATGYYGNGVDTDMYIWRYNSNGTRDTTFNNSGYVISTLAGNQAGHSIVVQPDGKLLVVGYDINPMWQLIIWRYNADGTSDNTFNGNGVVTHQFAAGGTGGEEVFDIALQADDKIVVTGHSWSTTSPEMAVWRFNPDGTLDSTFNSIGYAIHQSAAGKPNSFDSGRSIAIQTDGKIVVTGFSQNLSGNNDMVIWRYNADGTLDTSFNGTGFAVSPENNVHDVGLAEVIQADGKIVVAGYKYNAAGNVDLAIWRYNP